MGEYGKFFRKDKPDHYINTPLFYEAWKLLKADGRWAAMSWVVKVDAPTVFMPDRPRTILATKKDDQTGVYFQNCKISDFSLSSSGTCPGDRPKDKKKDTKFVPTCNPGETKAAVHPFRDVKSWFQCLGTMTGKQYS